MRVCRSPVGPRCFGTIWPIALSVSLAACASSGATSAALRGDLATLNKEIAAARAAGEMDKAAAIELAEAVATRELVSAQDDLAVDRVRALRPCIAQLKGELEEVASGTGAGAAAATLALLEAGYADPEDLLEAHLVSTDPNWRAVAARAALGHSNLRVRAKFMTDGDLRVRRAALHAAQSSPEPSELPHLLEAARLDPDPLVRSLAVQVIGKLGGTAAVLGLKELWQRADDATRQGIISAWGTGASRSSGGATQLQWALDHAAGLPAIVAAAQLSASPQAVALLERAIKEGPVDEQRLAIRLASENNAALMTAISEQLKPESGADAQTRVMAAARLVRPLAANSTQSTIDARKHALELLQKMAQDDGETVAHQARAALIAAGETSVIPTLKKNLSSATPAVREQAGSGLFRLGQHSASVTALGDQRGSVRTNVACAILSQR